MCWCHVQLTKQSWVDTLQSLSLVDNSKWCSQYLPIYCRWYWRLYTHQNTSPQHCPPLALCKCWLGGSKIKDNRAEMILTKWFVIQRKQGGQLSKTLNTVIYNAKHIPYNLYHEMVIYYNQSVHDVWYITYHISYWQYPLVKEHNCGKSPFLMGKLDSYFCGHFHNSYLELPGWVGVSHPRSSMGHRNYVSIHSTWAN